jgi:hypothetical protein
MPVRPHDIIPPASSRGLLGMRVEAAMVTRHLQYPYEQQAKHLPKAGFYNQPVYWVIRQIWLSGENEIMLINMERSARFGMGEGAPF